MSSSQTAPLIIILVVSTFSWSASCFPTRDCPLHWTERRAF